jgi:hypothetical protein
VTAWRTVARVSRKLRPSAAAFLAGLVLLASLIAGGASPAWAGTLTGATFTAPKAWTYTNAQNPLRLGFHHASSARLWKVRASAPAGTGGANRHGMLTAQVASPLQASSRTKEPTGSPDPRTGPGSTDTHRARRPTSWCPMPRIQRRRRPVLSHNRVQVDRQWTRTMRFGHELGDPTAGVGSQIACHSRRFDQWFLALSHAVSTGFSLTAVSTSSAAPREAVILGAQTLVSARARMGVHSRDPTRGRTVCGISLICVSHPSESGRQDLRACS